MLKLLDNLRRLRLQRVVIAAAILLAVGACGSPQPAPVVNRTTPPAGRPQPAQPPVVVPAPAATVPPVVASPAPAVPSAPAAETGVQTAPIRSSGVEVRPIGPGGPAADPRASATPGAAAVPPPAGPGGQVLTAPRGLKRPFSDQALAELRNERAPGAPAVESRQDARVDVKPEAKPDPKADAKADAKAESKPDAKADAKADAKVDGKAEPAAAGGSFAWPAKGKVVQGFAEPKNMGIWISGTPGDPVSAAADGKVIFSGPGPRGYGNLVIVKHDADTLSVYAHNRALLVKEGQQVRRGQKIAELGESGTDSPKLHFEIRKQGKPVDPQKLLPSR